MPQSFPPSIGDDYPEYVDDECGYQYHAFEVISASELARHEAIRRAPDPEALQALADDLPDGDDLCRWAVARRHLHFGDQEQYFHWLDQVIQDPREHPALLYQEIFADAARRRAATDGTDAAQPYRDALETAFPEMAKALPWLDARLLLEARHFEEAHQAYETLLDDDEIPDEVVVECCLEIAEDLLKADDLERAIHWRDRARTLAESIDYDAALVDLELLPFPADTDDP